MDVGKQGEAMKRVLSLILIPVVALTILAGCDSNNVVKGAKFSSLQGCLLSIKVATGLELDLVIDTPEQVAGSLVNTRRSFACTKEVTGTQGVRWDGWYEVESSKE
jgi:hypothetical protein